MRYLKKVAGRTMRDRNSTLGQDWKYIHHNFHDMDTCCRQTSLEKLLKPGNGPEAEKGRPGLTNTSSSPAQKRNDPTTCPYLVHGQVWKVENFSVHHDVEEEVIRLLLTGWMPKDTRRVLATQQRRGWTSAPSMANSIEEVREKFSKIFINIQIFASEKDFGQQRDQYCSSPERLGRKIKYFVKQ